LTMTAREAVDDRPFDVLLDVINAEFYKDK
jgi:hypothetical protein